MRHDGWTDVDRERVREILASSFGREPSEAVFERDVRAVYREEAWRGVAILVDTPLGAYLSKFAVSPRAQGEGMARELWDALVADHPALFWRARAGNPIARLVPVERTACGALPPGDPLLNLDEFGFDGPGKPLTNAEVDRLVYGG